MKRVEQLTKKELIEFIHQIQPKAEAYERICQSLGIENNILGHVKDIIDHQAEVVTMNEQGYPEIVEVKGHRYVHFSTELEFDINQYIEKNPPPSSKVTPFKKDGPMQNYLEGKDAFGNPMRNHHVECPKSPTGKHVFIPAPDSFDLPFCKYCYHET